MGSGDVVLHDTGTDVEAASDNAKDAASYGALDIKETTDEDATPKRRQDEDWHKDKPAAKKKKRAKKKHVRVSESLHEILVNRPHRPCCLHIFIFIEIVAILASLNLLITEIIPIIIAPPSKIGYLSLALRCYLSCFCLVFISVELEIPVPFIKDSQVRLLPTVRVDGERADSQFSTHASAVFFFWGQIFNNWISRGFLYSFVGLIGMEEAYSSRVEDLVGNANGVCVFVSCFYYCKCGSTTLFSHACTHIIATFRQVSCGVGSNVYANYIVDHVCRRMLLYGFRNLLPSEIERQATRLVS
jgi:hypothetical protein